MPVAQSASQDRVRGIILGTTQTNLDVGLLDQTDVHFDMALEPDVTIAEPADGAAIVSGTTVGVVTPSSARWARVIGAIVVPTSIHLFARGRFAWDRPAKSWFTFGRVVRRSGDRVAIDDGTGVRDVRLQSSSDIVTIRPGSRRALLSPQHCLILAHAESDGISDYVDHVIVADGTIAVPI